jgi:hypothetical protein
MAHLVIDFLCDQRVHAPEQKGCGIYAFDGNMAVQVSRANEYRCIVKIPFGQFSSETMNFFE